MADDNGQIVLGLDIPKTKAKINEDISKLQSQLDKAKITGELDEKTVAEINGKIASLKLDKIKLGVEIDDKQLTEALSSSSKSQQVATKTGEQLGKNITQGIQNAVNNANIPVKKPFTELNKAIQEFKASEESAFTSNDIKEYNEVLNKVKTAFKDFGQVKITNEVFDKGKLDSFKVNIEQVNGDLKETKSFMASLKETQFNDGIGFNLDFSDVIKGSESVVQHLDKTKNAVNKTAEEINAFKNKTKANSIKLDFGDFGTTTTNITNLITRFEQLDNVSDETKQRIKSLKDALSTMNGTTIQTGSDTDVIAQNERIVKSYKELSNEYKQITTNARQYATEQQRISLANSIEAFMQKNSKMTLSARLELEGYIKELTDLDTAMTKVQKNDISTAFKQSQNELRGLGKLGASIKDQFSQAATSFTQWASISSAIMALGYQLKNIPSEVKAIDDSVTDLVMATGMAKSEAQDLMDTFADIGKEYKTSMVDVSTSVNEWLNV